MITEENIKKLSEIFKSLSDPTRLKIIKVLLKGEENVTNICEEISMEQSATSHQLRKLKDLKLVKSRKIGRTVYYSIDDDHVETLILQGLEHVNHTTHE